MESHLQVKSYEVLYEIFRRLPKDKLIEISKLNPTFADVAGDTRFWKNLYIKYSSIRKSLDVEELYSEPWPVKTIDLFNKKINPPVSSDIGPVTKVRTLNLASTFATSAAIEAMLTKYQCTKLNLKDLKIGQIIGVAPEVFSKQTVLEVLSLSGTFDFWEEERHSPEIRRNCHVWLGKVLSNCKNLKTLDLSFTKLDLCDISSSFKNLPASLEQLNLTYINPNLKDPFFELLAEGAPNLRHLELDQASVKCPALLKIQFLETLRIIPNEYNTDINELIIFLIKFPALKTVYIAKFHFDEHVEKFAETLELHKIEVKIIHNKYEAPHLDKSNYWEVTKVET